MSWIVHQGGPDPFANPDEPRDVLVRVKFRNQTIASQIMASRKWRWKWGKPFPSNYDMDIIAYQEVES